MSNPRVNPTKQENALIEEADEHRLNKLDADALKDLQSQLRRAREKNFSLLRRQGAARVEAEGARGAAEPANQKREDKVDVLAEALARVTARLEAVSDEQ